MLQAFLSRRKVSSIDSHRLKIMECYHFFLYSLLFPKTVVQFYYIIYNFRDFPINHHPKKIMVFQDAEKALSQFHLKSSYFLDLFSNRFVAIY